MAQEKKQKTQEQLDQEDFLTRRQKQALSYYLDCQQQIGYIKKFYPSLLNSI